MQAEANFDAPTCNNTERRFEVIVKRTELLVERAASLKVRVILRIIGMCGCVVV